MWHWGTWFSEHGGDGLVVGPGDLSGLIQTLWFLYLPCLLQAILVNKSKFNGNLLFWQSGALLGHHKMMVKIPVRTWDFLRCFPSPLDRQATCWPDPSLSVISFTSRPEPQQKAPSAPPPPPPPPPPPLPEPTPPEPEEEILGSDDEEQEDPADYCKGGCSPVLSVWAMAILIVRETNILTKTNIPSMYSKIPSCVWHQINIYLSVYLLFLMPAQVYDTCFFLYIVFNTLVRCSLHFYFSSWFL